MSTLTLLHSQSFPIARYTDAFLAASIHPRPVDSLDRLGSDGTSLRVVLVDPGILNGHAFAPDSRTAVVGIGLPDQPSWLSDETVYFHLPENPSAPLLLNAVKRSYQFLYQKLRADQLERQLNERTRELRQVSEVGTAL